MPAIASAGDDVDVTVPKRDLRAATEYLAVVEFVPGMYHVYSENGTEYTVDPMLGACDCPDAEYRSPAEGCKHLRRVRMERGERSVPGGVRLDPFLVDALQELGDE